MDIVLKEGAIVCCHVGRSRTIDKDGIENIEFEDPIHHALDASRLIALVECRTIVGGVYACHVVSGFAATAHADQVEIESAFFAQHGILSGELADELIAHCAGSANKEVEFFAIAHEEGIVQDVECLAKHGTFDDKRDTHLEGTECHGVDSDAIATQHGKKSADCAGVMPKVLAHDGNGGQSCATTSGIHGAGGDFARELGIEDLASALGIGGSHGQRGGSFGGRLRNHEDADAGLGQRGENATIDTDNTDHGHAAHRD